MIMMVKIETRGNVYKKSVWTEEIFIAHVKKNMHS